MNETSKVTTIWFDRAMREQWPRPLADYWHRLYPQLFDKDDLRITRLQPKKHFHEWLTAIHLFHSSGALSLVEKYAFEQAHPRKSRVLRRLLTAEEVAFLKGLENQPPDLLAYTPDLKRYWFVEVKGPTDRMRPVQSRTHQAIKAKLRVEVGIVQLRRAGGGLTSQGSRD